MPAASYILSLVARVALVHVSLFGFTMVKQTQQPQGLELIPPNSTHSPLAPGVATSKVRYTRRLLDESPSSCCLMPWLV